MTIQQSLYDKLIWMKEELLALKTAGIQKTGSIDFNSSATSVGIEEPTGTLTLSVQFGSRNKFPAMVQVATSEPIKLRPLSTTTDTENKIFQVVYSFDGLTVGGNVDFAVTSSSAISDITAEVIGV